MHAISNIILKVSNFRLYAVPRSYMLSALKSTQQKRRLRCQSHRGAPKASAWFGASDAFAAASVDLHSALAPSTQGTCVAP
jgi:hypothetical protein